MARDTELSEDAAETPRLRRRRRRTGYVLAVVVAWGAGLVFAGRVGRSTVVPLAVVLSLPLAAVLAVRIWSRPAHFDD